MNDDAEVIGRRVAAALIDGVVVLLLLVLVGIVTVLLTAGKGRQRLGDMAAGTAVVRG